MDSAASSHHQQEMGLLELSNLAPLLDARPASSAPSHAINAPTQADLELCHYFLASSSPPTREALDALAQIVGNFFSSLPNQRGRFCQALLALPMLDTLAGVLRLESAVLHAIAAHGGQPPAPTFLSIDINGLASWLPTRDVVGTLMLQRPAAFDFRVLLLDRVSTLFLLVIHMVIMPIALCRDGLFLGQTDASSLAVRRAPHGAVPVRVPAPGSLHQEYDTGGTVFFVVIFIAIPRLRAHLALPSRRT